MRAHWLPKGLRGWVVLVAALLCIAVTARLGWWQLDRAAQKKALQSAIASQSDQAALSNSDWPAVLQASQISMGLPASWLHRPVQLIGRWLSAHTVYLENRQMQGRPGFYVLTPLLLDGGGVVMVQRGWVPRNFQDRTALPVITPPQGVITLTGRLAAVPSQLYALGADTPEVAHSRIRQNLDLTAFAQETGLALPLLSVVQTEGQADGLLRQWPTPDVGVSKHYGYAVQWLAMSLLTAALYLWFQILRPLRRTPPGPVHVL